MIFGHAPKRSYGASAVVTGAGSGIGAAFAIEIANRGGAVVCGDIDDVAAQRTVDAITRRGGEATAVHCDVSRLDHVEKLAAAAQSWFGDPPTLVVNNAGVAAAGTPIGVMSMEDWRWALGVNLWGPIHGCHVFTPILRDAAKSIPPRGIINVASAAFYGALPGMGPYSVGKAGVVSLSETLAAELSGTGIGVTVLCPTMVKTRIVEAGHLTERSADFATTMMRWFGLPAARVARTCLDTHDGGGLYCLPQLDAKVGWGIKRFAPQSFTRAVGLISRAGMH